MGVLLAIVVAGQGLAQSGLGDPPPPIEFDDWKEVGRDNGAIEYSVSFPSAIASERIENNTVPLVILVPENAQTPLPVVVVLHYWGAGDLRVERGLAYELNRRGIAAVIPTLPYHLGRTPSGFRSGELSIQPDP
ncbi:MAG TPA: hypothetical protein VEX38_10670, partial [Fimbriimonadaceae bacterium]|nr:hypothetical protein [Fimbriimonadaceae bacterium]